MTEVMNLLVLLAEGARFENTTALETIGPDRVSSVCSQSLTEESGVGEESINPIGHDSSDAVWPQFQQHERADRGGPA